MRPGLDSFDSTVHKTHEWLQDLMLELGWSDRHAAYLALRATLQALRDRLSIEEAVQLGAQLPMLVRGFYYEGWTPGGKPLRIHKDEFLDLIRGSFRATPDRLDPERVARAVFKLLSRRVSAGEIEDVKNSLPKELRELWPDRAA